MSDQNVTVSKEEKHITIKSMSVAGDSLYLACRIGFVNIGIENDEGCHSAYFDREHLVKLRDFLNEVLS
jgi:hypothetical protein